MNVKADVFPAVIALAEPGSLENYMELTPKGAAPKGTRRLDRCRVVVFNDMLMVAIDSPEGAKLVFREACHSYIKDDQKIHRVITESGKIVSFRKDDNCGCGSRLRTWNPYGHILMAMDGEND
jgi:hypothetical protein